MAREQNEGVCEHCKKTFGYYLIHNGFNNSSYAYCERCGKTALLDGWKIPKVIKVKLHQAITEEVESYLRPCDCGGFYKCNASPRCPHCNQCLSPEIATGYIESNAPGTKGGWRWQKDWIGLYCIILENHVIDDNWKLPAD
jgi:hypothetical protein